MKRKIEGIKRRFLHGVHTLIYKYWIDPLQRRIPHLTEIKPVWRRRVFLAGALWGANLGRLAITDFKVNVKRLQGSHWSIIYIGAGFSLEELRHTLFPTPPQEEHLSRGFVWQMPTLARQFARQGELVVCELNQIIHWRPRGTYAFTTPCWVEQVLDITPPMDDILAAMNQNMRRNLRKMTEQSYNYIYTQEQKDFDLFFSQMYRPYISHRYGKRATMHEYASLCRQFERGGLILVKRGQEPICGMLCLTVDDTCKAYQVGVHEEHFDQVRKGANVALWWFMMDWARRNNLRRFHLGASRPRTSNGPFNFKRQWGARVHPMLDGHTQWVFYGEDIPAGLHSHLNEQGFISEVDGLHYGVVLLGPDEKLTNDELARKREDAVRYGLDGILLISPQTDGKKSLNTCRLVTDEWMAEVG